MSVLLRMALTDEPVHDTVFWIDRPRPHMTEVAPTATALPPATKAE